MVWAASRWPRVATEGEAEAERRDRTGGSDLGKPSAECTPASGSSPRSMGAPEADNSSQKGPPAPTFATRPVYPSITSGAVGARDLLRDGETAKAPKPSIVEICTLTYGTETNR